MNDTNTITFPVARYICGLMEYKTDPNHNGVGLQSQDLAMRNYCEHLYPVLRSDRLKAEYGKWLMGKANEDPRVVAAEERAESLVMKHMARGHGSAQSDDELNKQRAAEVRAGNAVDALRDVVREELRNKPDSDFKAFVGYVECAETSPISPLYVKNYQGVEREFGARVTAVIRFDDLEDVLNQAIPGKTARAKVVKECQDTDPYGVWKDPDAIAREPVSIL